MVNTEVLVEQHTELLRMAECLLELTNSDVYPSNDDAIRMLLDDLLDKAMIHLAMEDQVLYPKLFNNSDEKIVKKAKLFMDEMGDLSAVLMKFILHWTGPQKIKNYSDEFCKELKVVVSTLSSRICKENAELFPLIPSE